jgi:hypothetical protein
VSTAGGWRDVTNYLAQSYLAGWGVWGCTVAFFQSVWWHFLNPRKLGISVYGIGMLLLLTVLFSSACLCTTFCAKSRSEGCRVATRSSFDFCFAARRSWIWRGVFPALAITIAIVPGAELRTACTALAAVSAIAGQALMMSPSYNPKLAQNVPTALITGLMVRPSRPPVHLQREQCRWVNRKGSYMRCDIAADDALGARRRLLPAGML